MTDSISVRVEITKKISQLLEAWERLGKQRLMVNHDLSVVIKVQEPSSGIADRVQPGIAVSLLAVLDLILPFCFNRSKSLIPPILLVLTLERLLNVVSKRMFYFKEFGICPFHPRLCLLKCRVNVCNMGIRKFPSPSISRSPALVLESTPQVGVRPLLLSDTWKLPDPLNVAHVEESDNTFYGLRHLWPLGSVVDLHLMSAKREECWVTQDEGGLLCFNQAHTPAFPLQQELAGMPSFVLVAKIRSKKELSKCLEQPTGVVKLADHPSPLLALPRPVPPETSALGAERGAFLTSWNPNVATLLALIRRHFDFSHSNPLFNKVYIYSRRGMLTSQVDTVILYLVRRHTEWGVNMNEREQRGMELAATKKMRQAKNGWIVPSQTGDGTLYTVNLEAQTCSCPDHETRQVKCKHIYAVEFTIRRETDTNGNVATTKTIRITYSQDWTAYNTAQTEEKERFTALLSDLCKLVPQPPQTTGRPRLPLSDMVFACAYKVYSGFSSRRFSSDMHEAHEDGLVTTIHHFNRVSSYLSDPMLTPIVKSLITVSSLPLKGIETDFAVDSSGFSTSRFVRWYNKKWGRELDNREWVKVHLMCGVNTHIVTAVDTSGWAANDTTFFRPLVEQTAQHFQIAEVSADKAYPGRKNLQLVSDLGATPFIPFKTNVVPPTGNDTWAKMYHYYMCNRDVFLQHYHKRSNVETVFSMVKGKFGDAVRSKTDVGQVNEVLMKVLCHNLCVLNQSIHELGIEATFSAEMPVAREVV